jgi:hypothetical protein
MTNGAAELEPQSQALPGGPALCPSCRRRLARFNVGGEKRCLPCTLRFRPLLRRSFLTAIFVGTVLTAINQGNVILNGSLSATVIGKAALTYCVPFCVATWGALINSQLQPPDKVPPEGL